MMLAGGAFVCGNPHNAAAGKGWSNMTAPAGFLSRLGEADRAMLATRWSVTRYGRDATILAHDEQGRDVFLLEGRARATILSEGGRAVAHRDIEPGDILRELSAIDGHARSASVAALEEIRVAKLSEAAFRELVNSSPPFAWALLEHLSAQMRRMTDRPRLRSEHARRAQAVDS